MVNSSRLPLVAVAAAALLMGPAFAGCLSPDGSISDGGPLALEALATERTTSPGGTVAFPVVLGPNATDEVGSNATLDLTIVNDGGFDVSTPAPVAIGPNGTGTYVTVDVPSDASTGKTEIAVKAKAGDATGPKTTLTVEVAQPDAVVEEGDKVSLDYTGRFPNGTVFATNQKAVNASPIPKDDIYRGGGPYQPLNITVGPNARFIQGLNNGLIGLGVDHDATLTIPPGQAYGNETKKGTTNRTETVDRTLYRQWRYTLLNRSQLEQGGFINASSEEGDTVSSRGIQFNITFLNDTKVNLTRLDRANLEVNDTTTHYEAWPNSSKVVDRNSTHIEFYVTPTTEKGEEFTWNDYWPNATVIKEITNSTIVLEHTPEVGTQYTPGGGFGRAPPRTVVEIKEDVIVYEEENQHPLAGETLVFDVTVLSAEEAQQQRRQPRRR